MRTWVFITTLALLGTIGVAVAVVLWVQTSLWLVWELVQPADGTAIAATSRWLEAEIVAEQMRPYLAQSQHLAWSQAGGGEVVKLAILPKLTQQLNLATKLKQEGWVIQRTGLVLQARLPGETASNWRQSSWRALRTISRPRMLGKKDQINWAAYQTGNQEIQVVIKIDGEPALPAGRPERSFKQLKASEVGPKEMLVQAPGQVWQKAPEKWRELVEGEIASRLDFIYTKPNFMASFGQAEQAWLWFNQEEKVAIGIKDRGQIKEQMGQRMREEERRERSETQAFRLPDGSLGWEKIPGEAKELTPLNSHCQQLKEWYLCEQGEKVVLADDKDLSLSQLSQEREEVEVKIGREWLKKEGVELESLEIKGSQKQVVLILKQRRKL